MRRPDPPRPVLSCRRRRARSTALIRRAGRPSTAPWPGGGGGGGVLHGLAHLPQRPSRRCSRRALQSSAHTRSEQLSEPLSCGYCTDGVTNSDIRPFSSRISYTHHNSSYTNRQPSVDCPSREHRFNNTSHDGAAITYSSQPAQCTRLHGTCRDALVINGCIFAASGGQI